MAKTYTAQINRLPDDAELSAALEYLCRESNKLYNCTTYLARQLYFKAGKFSNGRWLSTQMKRNPHMKALYTSAAQQTCISVGEAFKGFKELLDLWDRGELEKKPKVPNYRKSDGLFQISYPKKWLRLTAKGVRVPMGTACQVWFQLPEIFIPFPTNLDWSDVKELQIVPRAGYFDAVWIGKGQPVSDYALDPNRVLSIDHGLDNWLTCVDSQADSFIIDGKHVKALNQWYNKRVATIKEGKDKDFWCSLLDRITGKRNRQMRDAVNKAARTVINYCLENGVGTLVFGWNKGQKNGSNMGRKNNQKFVQVPTARLKKRIEQMCELYGIEFIEQEESCTSRASALDLDEIPVYGEKPEGWESSGKRVKRGLYQSADGTVVNADCNGAYNIGRKAQVIGMQCKPTRGQLTSPRRLFLWSRPVSRVAEVLKLVKFTEESPSL
ncbi:RNA-guided endonuclease TnpB family protein [Geitlerinema sp. PCC 9228]|uniref:RNA-guided endonuclease InsQ/TnpB family protein n=1 Tax=Geitlerinema sp. PCC 9228 TaxID=111611 RepID=UPI0008F9BD85|nr:RNA-guided endonuclease TnpB family protein [Geitlerinema sp. PCC 9228]